MARFLLGINYWPRSSAMYMWDRFDVDEIGEDMARIKALGLDVVRFFLDLGGLPARSRPHERYDACADSTHSWNVSPPPACERCRRSFAAT